MKLQTKFNRLLFLTEKIRVLLTSFGTLFKNIEKKKGINSMHLFKINK